MWRAIKKGLRRTRDFFWPPIEAEKYVLTQSAFNKLFRPGFREDFELSQESMVRFSTSHTQDDFYENYIPNLSEKEEADIVDDINLKAEIEGWTSQKEPDGKTL